MANHCPTLFVGSEGTFGVATEIEVRLMPLPEAVETLLALFDRIDDAARRLQPRPRRGSRRDLALAIKYLARPESQLLAAAAATLALNLTSTRAVQMAVDVRPFKKVAAPDHLFKSVARNKKVFATVLLARARRSRRVRNRVADAGHSLQNPIDQGAFAAA